MLCRHMGAGLLTLVITTTLAWADPVAQVVKLSGNVELIRDDDSSTLALGAPLEEGDTLKTDATSRVRIQLIDGSTVNIGSASEFLLDDVNSKGPGTDRSVGLDLWLGVLLAHAAPATPSSRFEIRTKKATTAVRGTQWGIYAEPVKSDVVVLEGIVGVAPTASTGTAVDLTKSMGVTVTDAGMGPPEQWSQDRIDALIAATTVPGAEVPFDLKSTAKKKKTSCPAGDDSCRKGGHDKGGRGGRR